MKGDHTPIGARLPALGARGEGWVVLQVALVVLLGAAGLAEPAWSGELRVVGVVVGLGLLAGGTLFMGAGIARLRRQLTPFPHPKPGGELITDGPFAIVRHPIYTGAIGVAIAWALMTASVPALVVAVAIVVFLDLKSRREEAWLADRFSRYGDYASTTPKLIPFLY
jgi:protein-S-isoprenylcysteine O-methyltransferase Ste14